MNTPNIERGVAVRRALLAVARECQAAGVPMPKQARLGPLLGCGAFAVWRHMRLLRQAGAIKVVRENRRIRITEISP